jgi:diguanylate cyclase (GGDEF)-like protein
VSISLFSISLFPIYTIFFLAPHFTELLVENTKQEAVRLAKYFSTFVVAETGELSRKTIPTQLLDRLGSLEGDDHLTKIKIFSVSGEIIYSTEPTEVGLYNREAYFKEIEATGTGRAEIIPKQSPSLDNEVFAADVVETYVPIKNGERLLGVIELYRNVSKERSDLNRLIYRSYGTLFAMALALLILVMLSSFHAHRSMKERTRVEEQLRLLSLTDDLTGLYNRRGFLALAQQQTRVARRDQKPMLVISADLDGLKDINDTFGHQQGDAAIAETAHILRESFRKSDVIARIGGDEFAVLLTAGEAEFDRGRLGARLQRVVDRHNKRRNR